MANVLAATTAIFATLITESPKPVIVDFWAEWCGPCKTYKPVFEELATKYPEYLFVSVNIDQEQEIAIKYGVTQIPTIAVFNQGSLYKKFLGGIPANDFKATVEKTIAQETPEMIPSQAEIAQQQLLSAIVQNDFTAVRACLQKGANPNHIYSFPIPMGPDKGKTSYLTPISMATGSPDMVQVLLEAGASADTLVKTPDGEPITVRNHIETTARNYVEKIEKILALIDSYKEKQI